MLSTMAKYSDNSLVVVSSDMKYRKKYMNLKSKIGSVIKTVLRMVITAPPIRHAQVSK